MKENNDWKQEVHRRYCELKSLGKSFFPYIVYKDVVAITTVFIVLVLLSAQKGVHLEVIADPTDTTYNPRPEWYFLFLFQLLKYFPGSLEMLAVVVIPAVIVGFLMLLPFIDRGPKRHPFDRPFITVIGVLGLIGVIYLGVEGYNSPHTNQFVEKNVQVLQGQKLYSDLRCRSCHSINGRGGIVAPALDMVGSRRSKEWMTDHFRAPQKLSPGTVMPDFGLLEKEIDALVVYLSSFDSGSFTPKAPLLFEEQCASCHKLGSIGEEVGPDLTKVGQYREREWLVRYIENPEKINKDTAMPAFTDTLTKEQIENLSMFLASHR